MTELQVTGFAILLITLVLTIVWAALMLHQDLNHIWSVKVEIRELLKKRIKNDCNLK